MGKGFFNQTTNKLRALMRYQYIKPYFPMRAKTTTTATIPIKYQSHTVSDGLLHLGFAVGDNIKDPFGDLSTASLGVVIADSTFEQTAHDDLDLIYTSYRVTSSLFSVTFFNNHADILGIVLIPHHNSTDPLAGSSNSWLLAINHPLAKLVWSPHTKATTTPSPRTISMGLIHTPFLKMWHNPEIVAESDEDLISEFVTFGSGTTTSNIFYHVYVIFADSTVDLTNADLFFGSMTMTQKLLCHKSSTGGTVAGQFTTDFVPHVA